MTKRSSSHDDARWLFFQKWMKSPLNVASVMPSSSDLARAMAAATPETDGIVIELGGGTGAITAALLARGVLPEDIVIVERDPHFCLFLEQRFPGIRILRGDARSMKSLLSTAGIALPVRAVVSGLPLLAMPSRLQASLLYQSFAVMGGCGPFIQFSYSLMSPLKKAVRNRFGVEETCVGQVWRNLPPAKIWTFYGLPNHRTRRCQSHQEGEIMHAG
ncbi:MULTISPECIES: hypothetical protein [Spongiibacter]|jgi:phosphatidylethanolamine/phosphatidyl-N-methylethanolamine N-methyltransferase|uniref:class I SAM-dependent methyltransferase n=1 Tax=Spongiibacter TaxID=630749 RepID=UPI001B07D459|nr:MULTISPECIES: hypothetical protein [Spongiibacter]MBO6754451.1 hypothetical protein [Spongiibacter sp.]|tara:strand:- start:3327 stop:3977 length:651 start_codon:yes stop_codon:yes gene_type:complete